VVDERELTRVCARLLLQMRPNDGGGGFTAFYRAERVQVPAELRRPPIVALPLYCYDVALDYALRHADQPVSLVHGVVFEPMEPGGVPLPWNHAWVEAEAEGLQAIFDPNTALHYQRGSYYEVLAARPLVRYSPAEARALLAASGWPGPWEELRAPLAALGRRCLEEIRAAVPDLADWVDRMMQADKRFAASYRKTLANPVIAVQVQATLCDHPEWWRQHRPGEEWPHHAVLFSYIRGDYQHAEEL
jgi:hypothetical protein